MFGTGARMSMDGGTNGPDPKEGANPEIMDTCPDEMTLAAYLDARMDAQELARMELHLARCGKCAKSVQELRDILGQVELAEEDPALLREVAERAKKIIDR